MPTFTNARSDSLEVTCGGFGGDNVLGTVEEKTGNTTVPVSGVGATVFNSSKAGGVGDDQTNNQGKLELLKKLVFKAFLLQGLKPPPLRPDPQG